MTMPARDQEHTVTLATVEVAEFVNWLLSSEGTEWSSSNDRLTVQLTDQGNLVITTRPEPFTDPDMVGDPDGLEGHVVTRIDRLIAKHQGRTTL